MKLRFMIKSQVETNKAIYSPAIQEILEIRDKVACELVINFGHFELTCLLNDSYESLLKKYETELKNRYQQL